MQYQPLATEQEPPPLLCIVGKRGRVKNIALSFCRSFRPRCYATVTTVQPSNA
jgi:hypothetical protein